MSNSPLTYIKTAILPRKLGRISFFARLVVYVLLTYWILFNIQDDFALLNLLIFLGYLLPFVAMPRARDCGLPTWIVLILIIPVFSLIPLVMLLFSKSRLSIEEPKQEPSIPFRKNILWLIGFAGTPWALFVSIWIINADYESKFFKPVEGVSYLGIMILVIAFGMSAMIYPFSVHFQKLRLAPERTWTVTAQMVGVTLVSLMFSLMTCALIALTPAAITMTEQMKDMQD